MVFGAHMRVTLMPSIIFKLNRSGWKSTVRRVKIYDDGEGIIYFGSLRNDVPLFIRRVVFLFRSGLQQVRNSPTSLEKFGAPFPSGTVYLNRNMVCRRNCIFPERTKSRIYLKLNLHTWLVCIQYTYVYSLEYVYVDLFYSVCSTLRTAIKIQSKVEGTYFVRLAPSRMGTIQFAPQCLQGPTEKLYLAHIQLLF